MSFEHIPTHLLYDMVYKYFTFESIQTLGRVSKVFRDRVCRLSQHTREDHFDDLWLKLIQRDFGADATIRLYGSPYVTYIACSRLYININSHPDETRIAILMRHEKRLDALLQKAPPTLDSLERLARLIDPSDQKSKLIYDVLKKYGYVPHTKNRCMAVHTRTGQCPLYIIRGSVYCDIHKFLEHP